MWQRLGSPDSAAAEGLSESFMDLVRDGLNSVGDVHGAILTGRSGGAAKKRPEWHLCRLQFPRAVHQCGVRLGLLPLLLVGSDMTSFP